MRSNWLSLLIPASDLAQTLFRQRLKSQAPANPGKARISSQVVNHRWKPLESNRPIVHRFVQPGEALILVVEPKVQESDVKRVAPQATRPIERDGEYPPRLLLTPRSREHVAQDRLTTRSTRWRDPLHFFDCLRPHLPGGITLRRDYAGSVERRPQRLDFPQYAEGFVAAAVREQRVRELRIGGRCKWIQLDSAVTFNQRLWCAVGEDIQLH